MLLLPIDLVLVRHGESDGNSAKHLSESGDHSAFHKLKGRHTSSLRLTSRGRFQAFITGRYINKHLGPFDRYYTSEYIRAKETAACMMLKNAVWFCDFCISERDWGGIDVMPEDERDARYGEILKMREVEPFFWKPPNGESLAQLCHRIDGMLITLARECGDMRVLMVCHDAVMWAFRMRLERMALETFNRLHLSRDFDDKIINCQILHYSRRNPTTGHLKPHYTHLNIIRPMYDIDWKLRPRVANKWRPIVRPQYSNQDLRDMVLKHEPLANK
ncbi:MAG: hypothetical protein JWO43_414 [Candidatus Adlerbacteria bacterium]|nr:hypothetical protein [Candidatus Adlerbacteria bacterium]